MYSAFCKRLAHTHKLNQKRQIAQIQIHLSNWSGSIDIVPLILYNEKYT